MKLSKGVDRTNTYDGREEFRIGLTGRHRKRKGDAG